MASCHLMKVLLMFRCVMRLPHVSVGLRCWWRSKVTFLKKLSEVSSTWKCSLFCFWSLGFCGPGPSSEGSGPQMLWMLQKRTCSSGLCLLAQFTFKGDKKTRKHLLLPAAKVGAAAPLMSRQLGLDLDSVFNVVPALPKKAVGWHRGQDGEMETLCYHAAVSQPQPSSEPHSAPAWSTLQKCLVESIH